MRVLGIIKARGSSTRLPGKNIRDLNGAPVLAYMCRAALASKIDRVILSTEDSDIADVGREYGVDVPFTRPTELADNFTRNEDIVGHALNWAEKDEARAYNIVVMLQPTTPFVRPEDIDKCIEGVVSGAACCFSARHVSEPPDWMFVKTEDGFAQHLRGKTIDGKNQHTQLLPKVYFPTGAAYAVNIGELRAQDKIYCEPLKMALMENERSVDIDNEIDFLLAEVIGRERNFKLTPVEEK